MLPISIWQLRTILGRALCFKCSSHILSVNVLITLFEIQLGMSVEISKGVWVCLQLSKFLCSPHPGLFCSFVNLLPNHLSLLGNVMLMFYGQTIPSAARNGRITWIIYNSMFLLYFFVPGLFRLYWGGASNRILKNCLHDTFVSLFIHSFIWGNEQKNEPVLNREIRSNSGYMLKSRELSQMILARRCLEWIIKTLSEHSGYQLNNLMV